MSDPILERVRSIVGKAAARRDADGVLRLLPGSAEAVAGVVGVAHDAGWRVAVTGGGTWSPTPPEADLVISLRALDDLTVRIGPDGVLGAGAGVSLDVARREVLDHGSWLPIDPPGRPDRTLGSLIATATAGPLRHGFGDIRHLVKALTVASGDGRLHHLDNDHDADQLRLHLGTFGGLGVITSCEFRLAPLPRADVTWSASADRDRLTATARILHGRGLQAAAIELFSPALTTGDEWLLAVRLLGPADQVLAEGRRLADSSDLAWRELRGEQQVLLWNGAARAVTTVPVTIRLGVLAAGIDDAIDLVVARLGEGLLSAGPASGMLRWSGETTAAALRDLRLELAGREIPMTIERAPRNISREVGMLGAYREGGGLAVSQLRLSHDPQRIFATPLDAETGS
jgi:glycolate oxidase FAD binding subunit